MSASAPSRTAEIKKENGNQFYKKKQYKKALPFYTEAICKCCQISFVCKLSQVKHLLILWFIAVLSPTNALFYGNRAACYMMLNQYNDALADVRKSLEIDPKFVKVKMQVTTEDCNLDFMRKESFYN